MPHFPMFIEIKDKPVLVVGGGRVALRKVKKLLPYGSKITVIAPEIEDEILAIPEVEVVKREFDCGDLEAGLRTCKTGNLETGEQTCPVIVIVATDDRELNHKIAEACHDKQIPVNVVDDPDYCSFIFPALVQKGKFSAGICTGGASPTVAAYYKNQLKNSLTENVDEILDYLEMKREQIKQEIPENSRRAQILRALSEECLEKGLPIKCEVTDDGQQESDLNAMSRKEVGYVALVGAGCGKADLITVRGFRLLRKCQAVVYDDLIDSELLEEVPESALRIYVGKRSGAHSMKQEEINQILIKLAKSGLFVVRLKGGDPYLFGRGGEEMLALKEAGIPCEEVPGIPSAIGIPAEAGIPVTHRNVSRGLHIVTAHTSDTEDGLPEDFDALTKLDGTLVFLMGLHSLSKIVSRLCKAGKCIDTPVAVISGGNAKHPMKAVGTLETIEKEVEKAGVETPAIILVGEVARMNL